MNILNATQVREWDAFTIREKLITSEELMEQAAHACVQWIGEHVSIEKNFKIFCGKGNNGGDGLAIARMLLQKGYIVEVYITEFGKQGTGEFQRNLQRLHTLTPHVFFIQSPGNFPLINTDDIIIDALLGSGLNKPADGLFHQLIQHLNHSGSIIISIDLPSGMFIEQSSKNNVVVKADYTLSFECYKLCFLADENHALLGELFILPIGLDKNFMATIELKNLFGDAEMVKKIYRKRKAVAHKGNHGHSLLAGGSYGKAGAMVLAAKACVHSGSGLTTAFVPACSMVVLQTAIPEAMVIAGEEEKELSGLPENVEKYSCIGIGPGMGTAASAKNSFSFLIRRFNKPMVIDADAINCLALDKELFENIPPGSVLTPHPKEFDRLFGEHGNEFERWKTATKKSVQYKIIIVLKGHRTRISLPDGSTIYNSTGNPGLAKGGSGDVLTGMITGLISQGYTSEQATVLGVYLHGYAADVAASTLSEESLTASEVILFLSHGFRSLQ